MIVINSISKAGFDIQHKDKGFITAFLTWDNQYDIKNIHNMKRHNDTDEVFILIKGEATLFITESINQKPNKNKLEIGKIYIVKKGTWHSLCVDHDALLAVIESSGTSSENTERVCINC